jgi:hypothetical protein
MGLLKTFALVGVAAGVGGFAGEKLFNLVEPKLPASVGPAARAGAKLGAQAGTAVITYAVLNSIF